MERDCDHLVADLRTLRLDTRFDAVFVHDAVDYLRTEVDIHPGPEGTEVFLALT